MDVASAADRHISSQILTWRQHGCIGPLYPPDINLAMIQHSMAMVNCFAG